LHERKIVHGDLRGSNILIGSDGLAKLAEFSLSGSSRASGPTDSAIGVFGSTHWQSPERVKGEEASFASDVYSLGLCILEALSGKIPWGNQDDVMFWKERWYPVDDARTHYAPGPLVGDDVVDLARHLCAHDPVQRVTASAAAQMLERLAAKERTRREEAKQPEPEPLVRIGKFKNGELTRLWTEVRDLLSQSVDNDLQRRVFDEVQAMYKQLGQSTQPQKLLEQFHKLLVDVDSMVRLDSYRNRIQRLSATRATGYAMDGIRRRLDGIWAMFNGSQSETETHKQRWSDQQANQLELFVSEVKQTLLVLNELDTEEDRLLLVASLKMEIDVHGSRYTSGQLTVIQKAYNDLVHHTTSDVLMTTPKWFLPSHELEVDNATCVGAGGFGGVYRARWLESQVVVKLLDQGGSVRTNDRNRTGDQLISEYTETQY
jgi:serine/threonine protein kinase